MAKEPNELPPIANNSLGSEELYEERKEYKDLAYSGVENIIPAPIDVWYDKPLYGKVDPDYNAIFLLEKSLKKLPSMNSEVFAINFVADAFTDFKEYMHMAANQNKISTENTKFLEIEPKSGWVSLENLYKSHVTAHYKGFAGTFLRQKGSDKKLITFKDFMKFFLDYLKRIQPDVPFTRTGFIMSQFCSLETTGLVIELADADHSDDAVKFNDYIEDINFIFYARAAKKFGFRIDKNAPWRLIADLKSDEMQKYMAQYPLPPPVPAPNPTPIQPDPMAWFSGSIGNEVEFDSSVEDGVAKKTGIIKSILIAADPAQAKFEIVEKSKQDSDMLPSVGGDAVATINGYQHFEQVLLVTVPHVRVPTPVRGSRPDTQGRRPMQQGPYRRVPGTQGGKYWFLNQAPGAHGIRLAAPSSDEYEYIWTQTAGPIPLYLDSQDHPGDTDYFVLYPDMPGIYEFSLSTTNLKSGKVSSEATAKIEVCEIPWFQEDGGPGTNQTTARVPEKKESYETGGWSWWGYTPKKTKTRTIPARTVSSAGGFPGWIWKDDNTGQSVNGLWDGHTIRNWGFWLWIYGENENGDDYSNTNAPGMWGWLTQVGRVPLPPNSPAPQAVPVVGGGGDTFGGGGAQAMAVQRLALAPFVVRNNIGFDRTGQYVATDRDSEKFREWYELDLTHWDLDPTKAMEKMGKLFWENWKNGSFDYLKNRWLTPGTPPGPFGRGYPLPAQIDPQKQKEWNRIRVLEDDLGPCWRFLKRVKVPKYTKRRVKDGEIFDEEYETAIILKNPKTKADWESCENGFLYTNAHPAIRERETRDKFEKKVGWKPGAYSTRTVFVPDLKYPANSEAVVTPPGSAKGAYVLHDRDGQYPRWERTRPRHRLKPDIQKATGKGNAHGSYSGCSPLNGSVMPTGEVVDPAIAPRDLTPEILFKTIIDFETPTITALQTDNEQFLSLRREFLKGIENFPSLRNVWLEKNIDWNVYNNITLPEWQKSKVTDFTNIFHRYYEKSFELDIRILKSYILDFFNSFVYQNPTVTKTKINKCNNGTDKYVVRRRMVTTEEMEKQYPYNYWIEFYASLRILESGHTLNKTEIRSISKKVKNLLELFPESGKQKALKIIEQKTKGVEKTS